MIIVYKCSCTKVSGSLTTIAGTTGDITTIQKHCTTTLSRLSDILIIRKPCDNFCISPRGGFILFTRDTRVRVINTHTCATFTRFTHSTDLCTAALHPNRNTAAVSDVNGRICFLNDWNVKVLSFVVIVVIYLKFAASFKSCSHVTNSRLFTVII